MNVVGYANLEIGNKKVKLTDKTFINILRILSHYFPNHQHHFFHILFQERR